MMDAIEVIARAIYDRHIVSSRERDEYLLKAHRYEAAAVIAALEREGYKIVPAPDFPTTLDEAGPPPFEVMIHVPKIETK